MTRNNFATIDHAQLHAVTGGAPDMSAFAPMIEKVLPMIAGLAEKCGGAKGKKFAGMISQFGPMIPQLLAMLNGGGGDGGGAAAQGKGGGDAPPAQTATA